MQDSHIVWRKSDALWDAAFRFLDFFRSLILYEKIYTAWKVSLFGVILIRISPLSDWIREHADQNNSKYGHFLRSDSLFPMT